MPTTNRTEPESAGKAPSRRNNLYFAAALLLEFVLLLALADRYIAWSGLDMRLLGRMLYYQCSDLDVHRISEDIALHYEPAPGTSVTSAENRKVTINSLGFRDPPRSAAKPPGVTRIVMFGGSNTYGALVADKESYPARLERMLNGLGRGKYEVWNAGVCAYVLPQNITVARRIIREYSPDLLIFQLSNKGRRPFLYGQPFERYFDLDPGLYRENLRFCWPLSLDFLCHWRLFRAMVIAGNWLSLSVSNSDYDWNKHHSLRPDDVKKFLDFYEENHEKVRMILLAWPEGYMDLEFSDLGIPAIRLDKKVRPSYGADFYKGHPPAYVYTWYAKEILADLFQKKFLPVRPPLNPVPNLLGRTSAASRGNL